jgi:hypothetical protein
MAKHWSKKKPNNCTIRETSEATAALRHGLIKGPNGLRAGWRLLIFFAILSPLGYGVSRKHPSAVAPPARRYHYSAWRYLDARRARSSTPVGHLDHGANRAPHFLRLAPRSALSQCCRSFRSSCMAAKFNVSAFVHKFANGFAAPDGQLSTSRCLIVRTALFSFVSL